VPDSTILQRRLDSLRQLRESDGARTAGTGARPLAPAGRARDARALAEALAAAIDGDVIDGPLGCHVRREPATVSIPIDRARLATLPGQPPADARLLCLDTETTGLGTAAGTVAFLIGLGWWEADRFRQVQLLLPDQPDEPALLHALRASIPADAWLVTYNGRGFDWPLLVARYRMAGHGPPVHGGHLDLLSTVRQLFRHRLPDARLRTVESELLGVRRHGDVEGWEIPGRYLAFLRSGCADGLVEVVRHNATDVRSLARLLAHLDQGMADPERRASAPAGDLLGLVRGYRRQGRDLEALQCLDQALGNRRRHDTGHLAAERLMAERAGLLRRLGMTRAAVDAWVEVASRGGSPARSAWVEVAKIREHVEKDFVAALEAVALAEVAHDPAQRSGTRAWATDPSIAHRRHRLLRRLDRGRSAADEARGHAPSHG